jgi:hypothetical protein
VVFLTFAVFSFKTSLFFSFKMRRETKNSAVVFFNHCIVVLIFFTYFTIKITFYILSMWIWYIVCLFRYNVIKKLCKLSYKREFERKFDFFFGCLKIYSYSKELGQCQSHVIDKPSWWTHANEWCISSFSPYK